VPLTLAMYEKSYEHIKERLQGLGLDLKICTFDRQGKFLVDGRSVPASEVDVDYFWLSTHVNADGFRDAAFDTALACKRIGILQTFNAGLDHPFYKQLAARGVRLCNSSAQGVAIAEYVLGQTLSILQPIELQRQLQSEKRWQITPFREVSQTHWLIIGFGPIGQELAIRLNAFGANISVGRRSAEPSSLARSVGTMADLPKFLPNADIIVLACPLNDSTRGFADAAFFAKVKTGAILVNIARGALVDEKAMLGALSSGQLGTAVLDVFHEEPLPADSALWSHPLVRLTSHTSFAGNGGRGRWDQLFLDNIARASRGEPLLHEVNPADIQ